MRLKNKKIIIFLMLTGCVLFSYWAWLSLRPVDIVAVHENDSHSYFLVKNFPLSNKGKIDWWLKNESMLKEKYNVPKPSLNGSYTIIFWYFGDGYKEEGKYDRFCFDDMKTRFNCIEKEKAFTVAHSFNRGTTFTMSDGVYRINENGDIIKID